MFSRVVVVVGLSLAAVLTACGQQCTLVGCSDVLTLEVRSTDGGLVSDFRGTVTLDGEEATFECPSTGRPWRDCTDAGVIELNLSWIDRTGTSRPIGKPARSIPVIVTAEDGGASWSGTLMPSTFFANGPQCGPECIRHVEPVVLGPR